MPRFARSLILVLAVGCAKQAPALVAGSADAAAPAETGPPPTAMGAALARAGLDVAHLPPLDAVGDAQLAAVMDTFTAALGLGCRDCHDADYAAATPRTRVARKMWDRMVRELVRADGTALYCDSCHAGRATFLDRSDARSDGALGRWMQASYVTPLARRDGATHDCASCHGAPFVGGFLDDWAADDDAADAGTPPAAPRDLGAAPDDLGAVGCEALLVCLDACAAGDGTCSGTCKRRASAAAKALLAAAQKCANDACVAAHRCRSASDDSADCDRCFSNASAGGDTGVACVPVDDPSCGACAPAWSACESS